jgi:hypothetical protein
MEEPWEDIDGSISTFGIIFFSIAGLIALIALLIFGVVVFGLAKGVSVWNRNNNSPLLTVPAVLVTKRQEHSRDRDSSTTWYFATFELPGHDRIELPMHGHQWGTLVDGDRGQLTYQGTRFKAFDRVPQDR